MANAYPLCPSISFDEDVLVLPLYIISLIAFLNSHSKADKSVVKSNFVEAANVAGVFVVVDDLVAVCHVCGS